MRRHLFVLLEISCANVRGIWMSEKSEYVFLIIQLYLFIVQKARETSTNIPRYYTVGYCTVPCTRSSCYLVVFFQVTKKSWKRLSWIINLL